MIVFCTNIFIPPGVHTATSSEVSSVCRPCVWFTEAIYYAGGVISCGWWPSTCIRHEASEVTIPDCLNIGQGQWFLWPLRERVESIHTIVSNSTTKDKANNLLTQYFNKWRLAVMSPVQHLKLQTGYYSLHGCMGVSQTTALSNLWHVHVTGRIREGKEWVAKLSPIACWQVDTSKQNWNLHYTINSKVTLFSSVKVETKTKPKTTIYMYMLQVTIVLL